MAEDFDPQLSFEQFKPGWLSSIPTRESILAWQHEIILPRNDYDLWIEVLQETKTGISLMDSDLPEEVHTLWTIWQEWAQKTAEQYAQGRDLSTISIPEENGEIWLQNPSGERALIKSKPKTHQVTLPIPGRGGAISMTADVFEEPVNNGISFTAVVKEQTRMSGLSIQQINLILQNGHVNEINITHRSQRHQYETSFRYDASDNEAIYLHQSGGDQAFARTPSSWYSKKGSRPISQGQDLSFRVNPDKIQAKCYITPIDPEDHPDYFSLEESEIRNGTVKVLSLYPGVDFLKDRRIIKTTRKHADKLQEEFTRVDIENLKRQLSIDREMVAHTPAALVRIRWREKCVELLEQNPRAKLPAHPRIGLTNAEAVKLLKKTDNQRK